MKTNFVHRPITLWTVPPDGQARPYAASAVFYPDDPFAVEFAVPFREGQEPESVLFARELLIDGLAEPAGEGLVRVTPHPDIDGWVLLHLPIERQRVEFWVERAPVDEFVDATLALVPSSREIAEMDLDGMIASLLEAAP